MRCRICGFLRAEHERLEREYAAALSLLTASASVACATEYNRLRIAADEARIDFEIGGLELARYLQRHQSAAAPLVR
jgi:hypothetical protein